ncbi:MAG: hypothetical protein HY909_23220 [Deltaproteobacteria bacterium]|nr:hypothetical protein [Deltaproteobacteria bacterium]
MSAQHPDDEALFALASQGREPPEAEPFALEPVRSHVDGCAACQTRVRRMSVGALLLDEVRREGSGSGTWEAPPMSPELLAVASQVASDVRSGRLRRPWRPGVLHLAGGTLLAAAAAWLFHVRSAAQGSPDPSVAVAPPSSPAVAPGRPGAGSTAPAGERGATVEARVLLATGGARVCGGDPDACQRLAGDSRVAEGARIDAPAEGRAVLSLVRGWTADVRGAALVTVGRLRAPGADLELSRGEVALAPGEAGALQVHHDRWTVIPEGPVVARAELGVLRVVVLAGRAEVREGGASRGYVGPLVLELPAVGAAREVPGPAADPRALDLASLRAQGVVTVALAQGAAGNTHGTLARGVPVRVARAPTEASPPEALPAAPEPSPTAPPTAEPALATRDATADEQRFLLASARSVFASCLRACRAQGTCEGTMSVRATFNAEGTMTSATMVGDAGAGARACLEREARTIRMDHPGTPVRFEIPVEQNNP